MAIGAVLGGCHGAPDDGMPRDPGELIDVIADLPNENDFDTVGGDDACARSIPCIVGPSEAAVTIETAEDFALLAGVRCITGTLRISAPGITDLSVLSSLELVCSYIQIEENPDLVDTAGLVSLDPSTTILLTDNPRLEQVNLPDGYTGRLRIEGSPLESLEGLSALTAFEVEVARCDQLRTVALPSLVEGRVALEDNAVLERLDVPVLAAGSVSFTDNPALVEVTLPALRRAEEIEVSDSPALLGIITPVLEELEALVVRGATGFTAMPALGGVTEIEEVTIEDDASLVGIAWLGSLARIGVLRILRNIALDQSAAVDVAQSVAQSSKVGGNAGWTLTDTCPFERDFECDEVECDSATPATQLCSVGTDRDDCCPDCSLDCPPHGG